MRNRYCILVTIICIVIMASVVSAQTRRHNFGLGFAVMESKPNLIFSFTATPSLTLEPTLFLGAMNRQDDTQWHIAPGIGILHQSRTQEKLRPLVGVRFGADILRIKIPEYTYGYISSSRSETYVDIVFGPVFGARYYFSDNFAVSGEFQISFVDTDSKGSAEIDRVSNAFYATTSELLAVYLYF
jgi:hypothetical protein